MFSSVRFFSSYFVVIRLERMKNSPFFSQFSLPQLDGVGCVNARWHTAADARRGHETETLPFVHNTIVII